MTYIYTLLFLQGVGESCTTAAAADAALAALRALPVFTTATHRITAYVTEDGTVL